MPAIIIWPVIRLVGIEQAASGLPRRGRAHADVDRRHVRLADLPGPGRTLLRARADQPEGGDDGVELDRHGCEHHDVTTKPIVSLGAGAGAGHGRQLALPSGSPPTLPAMTDLADLLATFELEPTGERSWRGTSIAFGGGGVVFGGQLLGQSMVAAAAIDPGKDVKSIHTVFARGGSLEVPLDIEADVMQAGRTFASASVTISQDGRICTRSLVLLHAPDQDLIEHQVPPPAGLRPEDAVPSGHGTDFWEIRNVDGVDIFDPDAVGPAVLNVWTRFNGAPPDPLLNQALLGFASDGFLIGTTMRPHAGVGQALAHRTISTSVITHTLTFHGPVDAGRWMLLCHESPLARAGRSYGRAHVFSEDGVLVASFVQENMIRAFAEGKAPLPGAKSAY
jgi:acyl-CoA thioesterase-2